MDVPFHLRSLSKKCGLRTKWSGSRKFPQDAYFRTVHSICEATDAMPGSLGPANRNHKAIAGCIALCLEFEGNLYDYMASTEVDFSTEDEWGQICLAAAWLLLEKYEQALKNGDWTPEET